MNTLCRLSRDVPAVVDKRMKQREAATHLGQTTRLMQH